MQFIYLGTNAFEKSRVQNKKKGEKIMMKKTGFTLAEVLITLGIIGVVAAMTMPT
ncbi:type II secretion system protein, partial [bacterium]|nr:type II secretion system protein [bacterium]